MNKATQRSKDDTMRLRRGNSTEQVIIDRTDTIKQALRISDNFTASRPFLRRYRGRNIIGSITVDGTTVTLHSYIELKEGAKVADLERVFKEAVNKTEKRRVKIEEKRQGKGNAHMTIDGFPAALHDIRFILEMNRPNQWIIRLVPNDYTDTQGVNIDYVKTPEYAEMQAELMLTARRAIINGLKRRNIKIIR